LRVCTGWGYKRNARRFLVGKPSLGRPKRRYEDNIKPDLKALTCKVGRRMELTQDCVRLWAFVLAMLNLLVMLLQYFPIS